MNIVRNIALGVVSTLLTTALTQAQPAWTPELQTLAHQYKAKFSHSEIDTVSGVCALKQYSRRNFKGEFRKYRFFNQEYFQDSLEFSVVLQKKAKKLVQAPLMIVFPGSFTTLDEDQATMWLEVFSKMGYHTLLLPNAWSLDFVKAKAKFKIGDFHKEAASQFYLAKYMIESLQKDRLLKNSSVQIFGLSHGAFIASMVNSLFAKTNINIEKTTLMSPALDLMESYKRLDHYISTSKELEKRFSRLHALYHYSKICNAKAPKDLPDDSGAWSRHIVALEGFQSDLQDTLSLYDELHNLNIIPKSRKARAEWLDNLHYSDYFKFFAPELYKLYQTEQSKLVYWIDQTEKLGVYNTRVILSDDDFINAPQSSLHPSFLMLRGGGHFAYPASAWFSIFMNKAFEF